MRRPTRTCATVVALSGLAMILAGCGGGSSKASVSSTPPTDKTLQLAFLKDPGQPPDPDVFYAGQGLVLQENVYEGLLQYEPGTAKPTIAADLATAWQVSPDDTTYTLTLRTGVTFHDGTPFDSSAIKASFDRRLAVNGGPAYMVADVSAVDTPSPTQAVIHLKAPNASFLSYLASPYGPRMMSPTLLAAHAGSDHDQKWLATHDAGTGPYTLAKASVGQEYDLAAYPGYWGKKPYFTQVKIPVLNDSSAQQVKFNQGDLAAIMYGLNASASASYGKNSKVTTYALPTLETNQVFVNPNKGFLTQQPNRVALLKAIDSAKIRKQVFPGRSTPATGNYPPGMLPESASPQDVTYDTGPLKKIVASLPADQKKITVGFDSSDDDAQTEASLIAADLSTLGLTANVQGLTTSTIFGNVGSDGSKAPDVLVEATWPDSAEAYTWAHIIFDGSGGLNYLSCSDPALTSAIAAGAATSSLTDPAVWGKIGVQALDTGCWFNVAYRQDYMVGQTWLTGMRAAHVVAGPTALLLNQLGVKKGS